MPAASSRSCASGSKPGRATAPRGGYVMQLGVVPYREAWELQRSLAGAVSQGAVPDTVLFLEHPPTVTLGRRTEDGEVHVPEGADVAVVETDRGGRRIRDRGDADRGADRGLARVAAEEDRLDRRPHQSLGDDARLRAQRRS